MAQQPTEPVEEKLGALDLEDASPKIECQCWACLAETAYTHSRAEVGPDEVMARPEPVDV